ncbi:MAG: signal peptide peptidase SppA [Bacteroidaceae bacterium]|nr:signal peptide peptidase SppA [Bacteroidaceae bacterium]
MKQFFKYVLATITGIVILFLFMLLMGVISIMSMSSQSSVKVKDGSVLEINLTGNMSERKEDNPLASLLGNPNANNISHENVMKAIKKAKEDEKIKGIYIQGGILTGATPAMLEEIHDALVDFKSSKKKIVAYADNYSQGSYYLASVADSIVINPLGMLNWDGLASQTMYPKDMLDKLGVKMEIFKVGTYKSAVEPYMRSDMSDENREQLTVMQDEMWSRMKADVGKSRKLSVDKLNALADSGMTFADVNIYKSSKLIDKTAYSDEVPQLIANTLGVDKDDYHVINVDDLASSMSNEPKGTSGNIIAVYYAYGTIVDEAASGLGAGAEIVGQKVSKDLLKLAEDDNVKALVLRVNSGGGSAYASEQIWHAVEKVKAKKPVVVSMGGLAASGGYYISSGASWIVAEPMTLTGSIGIFGMFPIAKELLNDKLGVHYHTVKTNEYADFGDFSRDMSEGEKRMLQGYVNRGYELFTQRCAMGRKVSQDSIKKIGEGRVWTGEHAKKIGLVDELGGLSAALEKAKTLAKVDEYSVLNYPAKKSFFDNLFDENPADSYARGKMEETFGEFYTMFQMLKHLNPKGNIQAELPYKIKFNL